MKKLLITLFIFLLTLPIVFSQSKCVVNGEEVPCAEITGALGSASAGIFTGIGVVFIIVWLLFLFVGLVIFGLWVWMLIDCAKREFDEKLMWIIIIIFAGWIGAILYYFLVKRKLDKK